jgi:hypothetical protein
MAQLHTNHTQAPARSNRQACAALACAAESILAQCAEFVIAVPDASYAAPSSTLRGGSIGKHLRHTLDHFAAALGGVSEPFHVIDYDSRLRDVPMETDRRAAIECLTLLRDRIAAAAGEGLNKSVRVRVMIDGDGRTADLISTLGRELAFATNHAIHHQAMMKAIAAEFGITIDDRFGKAPSTLRADSAKDEAAQPRTA